MASGTDGSSPEPPRVWVRHRLWVLAGAVVLLLLLAAAVFAASWHYSAGVLIPNHAKPPMRIEVLEVGPRTVKLAREPLVNQPKVYGLQWRGGGAILGPVVGRDDEGVTRRVSRVDGDLKPGVRARITLDTFRGNPQDSRGLAYRPVGVPGELGRLPAWQIGRSGNPNWAIFVHGINSDRGHGLRIAPALRRAGLTSLFISYRNDKGAPPAPDGKHHMGLTEWRDLQAAVRFAMRRGARNIALVGYSMGGAVVGQFMLESRYAERVKAMVLDSPALDWSAIIAQRAREMGLPGLAGKPVEWVIGLRIDADWDRLDLLAQTDRLRVPTLLIHGEKDRTVPVESSDEYAEQLPEVVRYVRPDRAGHVQAWNIAPGIYEGLVTRFLRVQMGKATGPRWRQSAR